MAIGRDALRRLVLPATLASAVALGVGGIFAANTSCSLLVGTDRDQCNSTEECRARGPQFAATVCGDDHVCGINAFVSCSTNKQCLDAYGGQPYFCRKSDNKCTQLTSPDCTRLLYNDQNKDLENDSSIFLGVIAPLTTANSVIGVSQVNSIELVRRDFDQSVGNLPPAKPGDPRRPLVFVVCDELRDATNNSYLAAADHLMKDVHVPAILGAVFSGNTVKLVTDKIVPANTTLLISATTTADSLTTLAKGNPILFYRTAPTNEFTVVAIAKVFEASIEPLLKNSGPDGVVPAGQPLKVAMLNKGDAFGQGFAAAVVRNMHYNGKSVVENADNFKQVDYGNNIDATKPEAAAAFANAVNSLVTYKPHVVFISGTAEAVTGIVGPLEQAWTEPAYRPHYIFIGGNPQTPQLLQVVGTNGDLRNRTAGFGPNPGPQNTVNAQYIIRYKATFTDGQPVGYAAAEYDAAYALAYAIVANGNQPVTGPNLSTAMAKLVPGPGRPTINLTPDTISAALAGVAGAGIDLQGASGPLNWNLATGDTETDIQLFCVTADANGKANGYRNSGAYFDAVTHQATGNFTCRDAPQADGGTDAPADAPSDSPTDSPGGG